MKAYYLGWDVGAWNCDMGKSRDALVLLSGEEWSNLSLVGSPWRGNLRSELIGDDVLKRTIEKTGVSLENNDEVTVAIDTPLGWPSPFHSLVTDEKAAVNVPESADCNPYLFRQTELRCFRQGFRPLSVVRDMIGSQSTKGLHFLKKAGLVVTSVGSWQTGNITAVEAYPSPSRTSPTLQTAYFKISDSDAFRKKIVIGTNVRKDMEDSLWCALIAAAYALKPSLLLQPDSAISKEEGWIWIPTDCNAEEAEEEENE